MLKPEGMLGLLSNSGVNAIQCSGLVPTDSQGIQFSIEWRGLRVEPSWLTKLH